MNAIMLKISKFDKFEIEKKKKFHTLNLYIQ
jgi:hypothetical protein